jgi:hypothetical protein
MTSIRVLKVVGLRGKLLLKLGYQRCEPESRMFESWRGAHRNQEVAAWYLRPTDPFPYKRTAISKGHHFGIETGVFAL